MWTNNLYPGNSTCFLKISLVLAACLFAIECKGAEIGRALIELHVKTDIPALILPDQHGEMFDSSILDNPVLVVNNWAIWCG